MEKKYFVIALVMLIVPFTVSASYKKKTPTPTPTPPVIINSTTTPAAMSVGAFTGDYYVWQSSFIAFESKVGTLNTQVVFTGFGDSFPNTQYLCPNQTVFNYWENTGYSLDGIIAGTDDGLITLYAKQAKAYGCPVIISIFHEMNGNWNDWDGTAGNNSPTKVINAWIHIHDIFMSVGATNVKFAWVL
jgi:hypothetical protein